MIRDNDTPIELPESFRLAHVDQFEMMEHLHIDDEREFWALYQSGAILPAVNLMPLANLPILCWPREDVVVWMAEGCPIDPELADRIRRVKSALVGAFEESGVHVQNESELN